MKKMLLMGGAGVGKSSMHSVIFANYTAADTSKIGYTVDKKEHTFKMMGSLTLNLWDCGGHDSFMEQYFMVQKETIFRGVQVLVYVFDIDEKTERVEKSLQYWGHTVSFVRQYSPKASIFVLLHKTDRISEPDQLERRLKLKQQEISEVARGKKVEVNMFLGTSIWNETLYQAWSRIVQTLVPNRDYLKETLKTLCETSNLEQAVLYERYTFLILSYYHTNSDKMDCELTYEKVANIIKHFKLTCKQRETKCESWIQSIFQKYLFTSNTFYL